MEISNLQKTYKNSLYDYKSKIQMTAVNNKVLVYQINKNSLKIKLGELKFKMVEESINVSYTPSGYETLENSVDTKTNSLPDIKDLIKFVIFAN